MNTLHFLSNSLIAAIPTRDADFEAAELIYNATFRSEPVEMSTITFGDDTYADYVEEGYAEWFDLPENTLICHLCNYKGEEEGMALYSEVKELPVFISRRLNKGF